MQLVLGGASLYHTAASLLILHIVPHHSPHILLTTISQNTTTTTTSPPPPHSSQCICIVNQYLTLPKKQASRISLVLPHRTKVSIQPLSTSNLPCLTSLYHTTLPIPYLTHLTPSFHTTTNLHSYPLTLHPVPACSTCHIRLTLSYTPSLASLPYLHKKPKRSTHHVPTHPPTHRDYVCTSTPQPATYTNEHLGQTDRQTHHPSIHPSTMTPSISIAFVGYQGRFLIHIA